MNAQQTAADLLSAANYIETYGLQKGYFGKKGKPCCTLGAIRVAIFGTTTLDVANEPLVSRYAWACAAVENQLGNREDIAGWSDHSTQDEVVAKLRVAAEPVFPNG